MIAVTEPQRNDALKTAFMGKPFHDVGKFFAPETS